MIRWAMAAGIVALAGCASNSGVVPLGQNGYLISRQNATGISGLGDLPARMEADAANFCTAQNKVMVVTQSEYSKGPYVMGNFPRGDLHFRCDERAAR
jgi:hypothetical protein